MYNSTSRTLTQNNFNFTCKYMYIYTCVYNKSMIKYIHGNDKVWTCFELGAKMLLKCRERNLTSTTIWKKSVISQEGMNTKLSRN